MPRLRLSPFLQDVALTAATSVVTMVALLATTRWLALALSPEEFGAYALSRRLVAWIGVYASVLGLTLTRNLATTAAEDHRAASLLAAALAGLGPLVVLAPVVFLLERPGAVLLFGAAEWGPVLTSSFGLVAATVLFSLVFARHRGRSDMRRANLWQLWALALGPALVAWQWAGTRDVALVNWLTALAMALPAVSLAREVVGTWRSAPVRAALPAALTETLRYGLPRVPGGLAVGALLAVGPVLAPHVGTLTESGYLSAGQAILRIVEVATAAFSIVVLPKVAGLQAAGDRAFLRERVADLVALTFHAGLFLCWSLTLWAPEIVVAWLGPAFQPAIPLVRILLLAVVPYLGYALLRSVADGLEERAVNAHNSVIALGVTLALSLAAAAGGLGVTGLAVAGSVGFAVLGGLTIRFLWQALGIGRDGLLPLPVIGANVAAFGAVAAGRSLLPTAWGAGPRLAGGLVLCLVAGLGYLVVLRRAGARWIGEVERRLVLRRAG